MARSPTQMRELTPFCIKVIWQITKAATICTA